jgi:hypothetical protein
MVSVLIKKKSRVLCSYLMMMNNGTPTKGQVPDVLKLLSLWKF